MTRLGNKAVPRQPCPYEGCGCDAEEVGYWGWYGRKDVAIPRSPEEIAVNLRLRRFMCPRCGRTFSWRPAFLAYSRRLAALFYQQAMKDWAYRRPRDWERTEFYELSFSAHRAFVQGLQAVVRRSRPVSPELPVPLDRRQLWRQLRHQAHRIASSTGQPRLAIHVFCLALARHRDGTAYRLSSS